MRYVTMCCSERQRGSITLSELIEFLMTQRGIKCALSIDTSPTACPRGTLTYRCSTNHISLMISPSYPVPVPGPWSQSQSHSYSQSQFESKSKSKSPPSSSLSALKCRLHLLNCMANVAVINVTGIGNGTRPAPGTRGGCCSFAYAHSKHAKEFWKAAAAKNEAKTKDKQSA